MVYNPKSKENHYDTYSDTDNIGFHDFSELTQGVLCIHTKDTEVYTLLLSVFTNAFPTAVVKAKQDGTDFKVSSRS